MSFDGHRGIVDRLGGHRGDDGLVSGDRRPHLLHGGSQVRVRGEARLYDEVVQLATVHRVVEGDVQGGGRRRQQRLASRL